MFYPGATYVIKVVNWSACKFNRLLYYWGNRMYGAILGDIIGLPYEFDASGNKRVPLFSENSVWTDDTVMTIAVADAFYNSGTGCNRGSTPTTTGKVPAALRNDISESRLSTAVLEVVS